MNMPHLMIDNREVEVPDGGTILEAAGKLRIEIPTMCFLEGVRPNASCMLCVVKVEGIAGLVPACATVARNGMKVQTDTDEIRQARKDALELLLSDHLGDCEGPCRLACPAGLNIPLIIRQIAAGETGASEKIPCDDCPAPCERACRRKQFDSPVSIRALMQYAAAAGLVVQPSAPDNRRRFSVHMGRLQEGEIEQFLAGANPAGRVEPSSAGLTEDQARDEARRCLHCDCRKADACKLRDYAELYGAKARRYKGERRPFVQNCEHPDVIYEPRKCIACGLCVRIAEDAREELGLTFIGRGFDVRVAVPFDRSVAEGLKTTALQCAAACPTGALSQR